MSFIIAAPTSGSGKTTVTLGILRALHHAGHAVRSAKSGPDYIDPQFHAAACGRPCLNLDAWAMSPERVKSLAAGDGPLVIEGAMGLFDGAPPDGKGATADLARILGLPVVLVVNAARMSHSVAALVQGFAGYDAEVRIAGVILNNVGSARHADMLRAALDQTGTTVLGQLPRTPELAQPSRHLGLVQAGEHPDLEAFLNKAADLVTQGVDLDALPASPSPSLKGAETGPKPPAKRIAIARDQAFSFIYAHQLQDWTAGGASLQFFSPLADAPVPDCDLVFLPGGYPELHAETLSNAKTFLGSLKDAAQTTPIRGECGGYMVLGEVLTDAQGHDHKMAGLLPLHTSFARRKLHLGYRKLTDLADGRCDIMAHEFHYASTLRADGKPLYRAQDAAGIDLGEIGLIEGNVSGSFAHLID